MPTTGDSSYGKTQADIKAFLARAKARGESQLRATPTPIGAKVPEEIQPFYEDRDGTVVKYAPQLAFIPFLDDDSMQQMQFERIFAAESLEAALEPQEKTDSLAEYTGEILTINSAGLRPSNIDGRRGVFAIINATVDKTGEVTLITTGATQPLAVIARAYRDKKMPLTVRAYEAPPAVKGQNGQLFLVTPEAF